MSGYQKLRKSRSESSTPAVHANQDLAVAEIEAVLNQHKQAIFNAFHPVGQATSVKVHDVTEQQSATGPTKTIRFTLYWEGPITKGGFTNFSQSMDVESGRWYGPQILATNGITMEQTGESLGKLFGVWLPALSQTLILQIRLPA